MAEDGVGRRARAAVTARRSSTPSGETDGLKSQDSQASSKGSRARVRAQRQAVMAGAVAGLKTDSGVKRGAQPQKTQRLTRSQAASAPAADSGNSSSSSSGRCGSESPTLCAPEQHKQSKQQQSKQQQQVAAGVVTRSMARRKEEVPAQRPKITPSPKAISLPKPIPLPRTTQQAALKGTPPATTPPALSASPDPPQRLVRRSPQFNYDRFIPARTATDLRMYEPRAVSPTFSPRRGAHIEHRAQVDEANRTYDALLRAELLNDGPAADDMDGARRVLSSSPSARRDAYRLSSSPNTLPSLVPWSSSSYGGGGSSRPTTPPPGAAQRPVFTYKSPRKVAVAGSAPAVHARNLFGRASPVHDVYHPGMLAKESRRMLAVRAPPRAIARDPVKVLDAPGIRDDYYLNLMDWSADNRVSVALNSEVYVWDAASSQTTRLCDVGANASGDWVTAVRWAEGGRHLAVGLSSGGMQIWDATRARCVRTFAAHTRRVGVLEWNSAVVSSGSRDKRIHNRDTRMRESALVSTYYGHTQEVCGLRWSPDRSQLASGGNDNQLLIWDPRFTPLDSRVHSTLPDIAPAPRSFRRPLFRLTEHAAAVKALAWCPTRPALLASGGGTEDRCIRLWNTLTGQQLSSHDTHSQVCNLAWSHDGSELVSTHGYSENHVVVWKYPAMSPIALLSGHSKRVLYLAHSPDGRTIATAAADETIRFWDIFPKCPAAAASATSPIALPSMVTLPGSPIIGPVAATASGIMLGDLAHIR
ncbi:substrate-specific activator of APC-dependent proteolysis [Coemansia thaxteri]|uniref:Substrate-specific activator of APC-dependent proteolysis n=1 Tax=Coemansia thaxteri TaxID=2663907 RepID=A0A9W8EHC5_9FUNG|nr:substrate-specific activator of APC-dependent proteolysis [Coemansia thaxteri]KAJ2007736.1 substrate-specific activator of APC-dependent proteolysis [Coemansia thaxteri]KAJ2472841.1 substrate-specific activator of APC-dependent proteolysis [Coemansia sp. RSA 2322]